LRTDAAGKQDDAQRGRPQIPGLVLDLEPGCQGIDQALEFLIGFDAPGEQGDEDGQGETDDESEAGQPKVLGHFTGEGLLDGQVAAFGAGLFPAAMVREWKRAEELMPPKSPRNAPVPVQRAQNMPSRNVANKGR